MDEPAPNVGAGLGPTAYDTIPVAKDLPKGAPSTANQLMTMTTGVALPPGELIV
jgi:hypothetical protein